MGGRGAPEVPRTPGHARSIDTEVVNRRSALLAALVLFGGIGAGTAVVLHRAGGGRSSAAAPAPDPASDEGPPIVLRGDGLGPLRFGAPADEVIAGLTLRWAPPTSDTGWIEAGSSPFGVCPGKEVRAVGWRGFSVLFSDGPTPHGPASRRHFFTWEYRMEDAGDGRGSRPPLHTERGVSVGATVAQLRLAYGTRLQLFDEPRGGPGFRVQLPDGPLFGSVTNREPAGRVLTMVGGGGCGH